MVARIKIRTKEIRKLTVLGMTMRHDTFSDVQLWERLVVRQAANRSEGTSDAPKVENIIQHVSRKEQEHCREYGMKAIEIGRVYRLV